MFSLLKKPLWSDSFRKGFIKTKPLPMAYCSIINSYKQFSIDVYQTKISYQNLSLWDIVWLHSLTFALIGVLVQDGLCWHNLPISAKKQQQNILISHWIRIVIFNSWSIIDCSLCVMHMNFSHASSRVQDTAKMFCWLDIAPLQTEILQLLDELPWFMVPKLSNCKGRSLYVYVCVCCRAE